MPSIDVSWSTSRIGKSVLRFLRNGIQLLKYQTCTISSEAETKKQNNRLLLLPACLLHAFIWVRARGTRNLDGRVSNFIPVECCSSRDLDDPFSSKVLMGSGIAISWKEKSKKLRPHLNIVRLSWVTIASCFCCTTASTNRPENILARNKRGNDTHQTIPLSTWAWFWLDFWSKVTPKQWRLVVRFSTEEWCCEWVFATLAKRNNHHREGKVPLTY